MSRSPWLMALGAVSLQKGSDAVLAADLVIVNVRKRWQYVDIGKGCLKVTGITQGADLIGWAVAKVVVPVQLGRVEPEGVTGSSSVTGQTLAATGIMPDLGPDHSLVLDQNGLIQALIRD